jgi:hypothetical protein
MYCEVYNIHKNKVGTTVQRTAGKKEQSMLKFLHYM